MTAKELEISECVSLYKKILSGEVRSFPKLYWNTENAYGMAVAAIQYLFSEHLGWDDELIFVYGSKSVMQKHRLITMLNSVFGGDYDKAITSAYPTLKYVDPENIKYDIKKCKPTSMTHEEFQSYMKQELCSKLSTCNMSSRLFRDYHYILKDKSVIEDQGKRNAIYAVEFFYENDFDNNVYNMAINFTKDHLIRYRGMALYAAFNNDVIELMRCAFPQYSFDFSDKEFRINCIKYLLSKHRRTFSNQELHYTNISKARNLMSYDDMYREVWDRPLPKNKLFHQELKDWMGERTVENIAPLLSIRVKQLMREYSTVQYSIRTKINFYLLNETV